MHRVLQIYRCRGLYLKEVGKLLGVDLPVWTQLQLKGAITDALNVVGRDALAEDEAAKWLTKPLSLGVHTRPEGAGESQMILML